MVDGADQQPAAGAGRAAGSSGGFGPEGAWRGYHDVIDHFAARSPRALAVEDAGGAWSYTQLRAASLRAAALLAEYGLAEAAQPAPSWSERPTAPRPLAVWAPRGRELIALCVGAWRLGLPVVALSRDMADKALELERNRQAVKSLRPLALVSDERGGELLSSDKGAKLVSWAELLEILRREEAQSLLKAGVEVALRSPVSPQSALVYVYTGGTTKASKCVTVTHAMALWEAENYSTALRHKAGPGDKMLQYSTLYWGAAVFGQISIGFAVGACVCIGGCPAGCTGAGDALRQLVADVEAFQITVLGVVPSQLRGAWPDGPAAAPKSIHTVVVWADKCPPELSRRWKTTRIQVVDLLIASEYWLALHSDCSSWSDGAVEKHVYRALPALEARFLVESVGPTPGLRDARPGEVGEMYLAGPTTSPGYVCPDGRVSLDFHDAARVIDGRMYLRTRDQLLLLEGGGLVYSGRADSMMKHGGQWVDADALQDAVVAVPGAAQAAVLPSAHGIDAFVVLHSAGRRGGEDLSKFKRCGGWVLQAIQLTEAIRREFQKPLGVSDVLRCTEFSQLAEAVDSCTSGPETVAPQRPRCEAEPWRIWLCGMGPRTCSVDWMVSRADRGRHLDVTALQRALDRLVARHAVLRCRNASEVPAFDATYLAASMWQLWCARRCFWTRSWLGRLASASIFRAWPRTTVLNPADPSAKVSLLRPTVAEVLCEGYEGSDDNRAFWAGGALCARGTAGHLFHVCVIPVFKDPPGVAAESDAVEAALAMPPSEVRWYVYAVLDHGYCDGPAGAPLFADFLRLYAEEAGEPAPEAAAANANHRATQALEVLQQRLKQSLKPLPEAHHPNHDIFHDGLVGFGWRRGYQRHIRMDVDLMRLMRVAAREVLGCSVDVAWLTVIAGAFLRLFPHLRRLDLYLVVTCRDGPGEEAMIGYFSSRKIVQLEVGDPRRSTLLGLADNIATVRRERSWRRPRPFEKADAIEVNIVSQAADGLPLGFQEVRCSKSAPRDWSRGATSNMNLRLDQTERDGWDFRLQSHDASWGWKWSSYYAQAMGSTIVDMALRPTDGIVPSAE